MNKKAVFLIVSLFAFFVLMPDAFADTFREYRLNGADAHQAVVSKLIQLLIKVIGVVMVLGGFGLVGIAVGAIFGKINWKWAAYLGFGLFICAICFSVLQYFTGWEYMEQVSWSHDTGMADPFVITPSD